MTDHTLALRPALGLALTVAIGTALAAALPLAAAADDSGTDWSLERLDLAISYEPSSTETRVSGTATLSADRDGSLGPTLALNSREAVFVFREVAVTSRPGARVDLESRHPSAEHARLAAIRFESPFAAKDTIAIAFTLDREADASQAVFRSDFALVSWVEAWIPAPIVAGDDPFSAEKAAVRGETTFHLPANWRAVSNGERTSRTEAEGQAVETWVTQVPVARSWAAGPYEAGLQRFGEREIGVYLLSPRPDAAREQAATLARALEAMEARFGPYPYPSYGVVELPEDGVTWYAAAEQGFIVARTSAFEAPGGNVPLFAHEAAHGWWGNLVNAEGDGSLLCTESLAQYGAVVAIEALEGESSMTEFLEYSREGYSGWQCALGYFGIVRQGGDKPLSRLTDDHWDHNLSDSKGHWFFHMLRGRVGDDVFFGTLRSLVRDFAEKTITLDDVRAAFVAAAPEDAGMARFLAQWLDRPGAPVLDLEWWAVDRGAGVDVVITQIQNGEPYALDLELEIVLRNGEALRRDVAIDARETSVSFEVPSRAVDVRLDPDVRLLLWRPRYGSIPAPLANGS